MLQPTELELQAIARSAVSRLALADQAAAAISPAVVPQWSYDAGQATGRIAKNPDTGRAVNAWRCALKSLGIGSAIYGRSVLTVDGVRQLWVVACTVDGVSIRVGGLSPVMTATARELVAA